VKYTIDICDAKMDKLVIKYLQESIDTHNAVCPDENTVSCLLGTLEYIMPQREYQCYVKTLLSKGFNHAK
jgi:hypothetical protein